ncbi:hypothetical protein ACIJDO_002505 [Enterococcus hirae]
MEERMEELNQKQYNHFDYYLLFAQFLTDETEQMLVELEPKQIAYQMFVLKKSN